MTSPVERLLVFLDIANRETTPRGERENAAMHVCRILRDPALVSRILGQEARVVPRPGFRVEASLLLVKETPFAYRFARVTPRVRREGARWVTGWLQKADVESIEWATEGLVWCTYGLDPNKDRIALALEVGPGAESWVRQVQGQTRRV